MTKRSGQVAVYLVFVLLAITVLTLMNVGVFLGVSARNKTMNGGDAAALAVAQYQGTLLNRIGSWNIERLKAAVKDDRERCDELFTRQLRCSFLDPLEGITIGNEAAKRNGCDKSPAMREILAVHARDVRTMYLSNPEAFPEPWEGAWEEYAQRLEVAISGGIWAGPDNIDFMNVDSRHHLLDEDFYLAIAGRNWCWFHFHAPDLLTAYSSFKDWGPLPIVDADTRRRQSFNCEVYSLHLDVRRGSALDLLGTNLVMRLTGAAEEEIARSSLLNDREQFWVFYDTTGSWRNWWEMDPLGEWAFPIMGRVRSEYDVRGAAAICRVEHGFSTLVNDSDREAVWSAAAKPFGAVENEEGERDVVTATHEFVTDAMTDAKLVPLDSVGGRDLSTANPQWMAHIRNCLPRYFQSGVNRLSTCWYCQQLVLWEKPSFRSSGARWLKLHSSECVRPSGSGSGHGGSGHGH